MKKLFLFFLLSILVFPTTGKAQTDNCNDIGYPTVDLVGLTWMAENMDIELPGSFCYDDDPDFCEIYGRLYTWEAAQTACQELGEGWRLPTQSEWATLFAAYGGEDINAAGFEALTEGGSSGFDALLGGSYETEYGPAKYFLEGTTGDYWSSTEADADNVYYGWFYLVYPYLYSTYTRAKISRLSCRCVREIDYGIQTFYADSDGDGYGDPDNSVQACTAPEGYVTDNTDCDDQDALEYPGQRWYLDADNDNHGESSAGFTVVTCNRPPNYKALSELNGDGSDDCDDQNPDIKPGAAELCNGEDDNCDGRIDEDDPLVITNVTARCRDITVALDQTVTITADQVDDGSTVDCGQLTLSISPTEFDCSQVGTTQMVTLTAVDAHGNTDDCTAGVRIDGLPCGFTDPGGIACNSQVDYVPASGTFTLQTNGCSNNSPYNDTQGFIAYELCGNGSISFQLASLSSTNAFAGIALRAAPDPGAVKAEVVINRYFTARVAVRTAADMPAWPTTLNLYGRYWLKLERLGNQVRIYTSADGQSWSILMVRNLTLPNCVYVGMVAYGPGAVTATFDNVKVNGCPHQTSPLKGGGFPSLEDFSKPSTVHRLPSTVLPTSHFPLPTSKPSTVHRLPLTEAPLPSPAPKGSLWERGETGLTLAVYPNPSSGQLTVELPADLTLEGAILEVLDGYGRSVLRETSLDYQQRLDLSRLPAGAYFVRLQTPGEAVTTRVVVQD